MSGLGDNSVLGQNVLNVDNSRLRAMADARAAQVATYFNGNYGNEGRNSLAASVGPYEDIQRFIGRGGSNTIAGDGANNDPRDIRS
jgi:hypothetical protein